MSSTADSNSTLKKMSGLVVTGYGPVSKVVKLSKDLVIPKVIKDNDILVQVYYSSIHMGDWKISNGDLGALAGMMGFKLPYNPGQDYSGKVLQIGKGVKNFAVGDDVYGMVKLGHGTAVQYIIVTEDDKEIYKLPNCMTLTEAASIQCSFETTYEFLVKYGKMKENESILILGGSTCAGMYGIQIAKNHFKSNNVTVTSSSEELCKSLGADKVINYKNEQWEKTLKDSKFDIILDVIGGKKSWDDCRKYNVIKKKGRYITLCGDLASDAVITCSIMCGMCCSTLNRKFWGAMGEQQYIAPMQSRSAFIEEAIKLIIDKKVKPMVDDESPYNLDDYMECYNKGMAKKAHGKLLLKLCEESNEESGKNIVKNMDNNNDEQKYDE